MHTACLLEHSAEAICCVLIIIHNFTKPRLVRFQSDKPFIKTNYCFKLLKCMQKYLMSICSHFEQDVYWCNENLILKWLGCCYTSSEWTYMLQLPLISVTWLWKHLWHHWLTFDWFFHIYLCFNLRKLFSIDSQTD